MATKNLDPNKLLVGIKDFKKEDKTLSDNADKIVKRIHDFPAGEKKKISNEGEETIRTTLDIPKQLHKQIRLKTAAEELTMKDYFLSLAKKDLNL